MAKQDGGPSPTPGENEFVSGYPPHIFSVTPGEKYLCCNCHNVLKKAQQTPCGHRYCSACLSWIVRTKPICIKCMEEAVDPASLPEECLLKKEQAFGDAATNKEISELKVQCVAPGCQWKGVLKEYDDHQSLCDYALIPCHTGCGCTVIRRELADHLEKDCRNNAAFAGSRNKVPGHTCDKKQSENLDRRRAQAAEKGKGCKGKVKELGKPSALTHSASGLPLNSHSGTDKGESMVYADSNGSIPQKLILSLDPWDGEPANRILETAEFREDLRELSCRTLQLETKVQVFENIIAVLNKELDNSHVRLTTVQEQRAKDQMKLKEAGHKLASLQAILAIKDTLISELNMRVETLEQTSYDGVFLWKITNLKQKFQDATSGRVISLYSPAFYSSRYGYKVCLRIYLNGDGAGKGTHVSLFFTIMKGEYDNLLPWPFKNKVTFMLLDQSNREPIIDAFRPDFASVSFQRPVTDMNIASGCPLFCQLAKLQSPNNHYIKDDAMFIRCIIDSSS